MPERFSASNAAKHMACHASANLELAIPYWTPPVVDEMAGAKGVGTNRHALFEQLMNIPVRDQEHFITVLQYIVALRRTRRFKVLTEETVEAIWLAPDPVTGKRPTTTVDLVLYTTDEIHVIDLKWGRILVDVHDNDQLLYYGACFAPLAPKAKEVNLHILQPTADNMEQVTVTTLELAQWMDRARKAQAAIHAGDTTFGPSDHCKFCPAYPHSRGDKGKPLCPATMQLLYPAPFDEDEILNLD